MESGKDASFLESRTVHARSIKCQLHERERINSSSSSPNKLLIIKNFESTQRERKKIRGIDKELSEGDKRLKRAKGLGSHRWEYNGAVVGKLDSTADSHPDTEGRNSPVESIFKMGRSSVNEVLTSGRTNESNSEGEEGLEQFHSFLGVMSTVERKESLLDKVAEEETELKLVLGELGLSRKKRVESSSAQPNLTTSKIAQKKALPASGTTEGGEVVKGKGRRVEPLEDSGEKVAEGRSASVDDLKEVARLVKRIWLGIEEHESELKKAKSELEKNLARAKTESLKEVGQLKAARVVAIGQLQVEAKDNLDDMAEERDRQGCHLMLKGYSQEEVDAIKADTNVEEEAEVLGVMDGLDGVSPQTVLDNRGDDVELPEVGSEKVVREMSLRIKDIESGLARERETSKALLSARAKLQFDRMKEVSENRDDQYVNEYFRLEKLNQAVSDLSRLVEEKDSGINKGLEDLSEATECDDLNERVARLKAENDQDIACTKKAEAREHSGGIITEGNAQKGNTNLRECQHKLDASLIREKVLKGEIKAKELLGKVDAEINAWKDNFARLKVHFVRLKARFATVIVPGISRSDLSRVIVAYFVEEVKRLESERDTLLKTLTDKGCTYGAIIDRGNCLGAMETQLGPRTAESVE
ncbi:hypothetical protein GIB67_002104 [Kingdonia uniflora]|uniref:Uncharacterized protein n=1 Tax=Kingdonia uniflora TaxID=39325 RepID=A0A7J7KWG0_9MAGN|nr:hypothetical protein GIB67_002104 [Kingdonia uniflora]